MHKPCLGKLFLGVIGVRQVLEHGHRRSLPETLFGHLTMERRTTAQPIRADDLQGHDLPGFVVGLSGKLVGVIGVLQCSFRMPLSGFIVPLFIVLSSSTMGMRRKFVKFGGFPVRFVHSDSLHASHCTRWTNFL